MQKGRSSMKRVLSLILALVLCLCLFTACGSKSTKLTTENYSNYMNVNAGVGYTSNQIKGEPIWFGVYANSGSKQVSTKFATEVRGSFSTSDVVSNFNYQDVTFTVKFTGSVSIVDKDSGTDEVATVSQFPFEFLGTFDLMLNGEVKDSNNVYTLPLPDNMVAVSDTYNVPYDICQIDYTWEIVEITGTVMPA